MLSSKKISILKDTAVYAVANYIVQAIGIVNSIALRGFMGPASMGIWSVLQVVLGYCGYASFGTTKAMQRDYPYYRGRGEHDKAERLKDLTLTFSMLMSVIPAAILIACLILRWNTMNPGLRIGFLFLAAFLFLQRFYDIIITLLRSDKKFSVLSRLVVINALGGLLITFLLVSKWNLYGLLGGTALVIFGCLLYIRKAHPYRFGFFWDRRELYRELKLGIPLVIGTFLFEFLISMDKLIIAQKFGFYEVGLYSIAMMASQYIYSLPMMFTHVWYPNLVEEYGRVGNPAGIKKYLLVPVFTLSIVVPFLCGLAIFAMPVMIHWFLPKFQGGLPVMQVYLIGAFFVMLAQFSNHFLVTLNKYIAPIPFAVLGVGLNFILNLFFIWLGWGVKGVALGSAVSFVFYGLSVYILALKQVADFKEISLNILAILGKILFFAAVILILENTVHGPGIFLTAVMKAAIFVLFAAPFLRLLEKRTKLITHLEQMLTQKFRPRAPASFEESELIGAGAGAEPRT